MKEGRQAGKPASKNDTKLGRIRAGVEIKGR